MIAHECEYVAKRMLQGVMLAWQNTFMHDEPIAINARFPKYLVDLLDAVAEKKRAEQPGVRFSRSDMLRMAVEEFTRDEAPRKKAAGRR